jgi:hypothetical protein
MSGIYDEINRDWRSNLLKGGLAGGAALGALSMFKKRKRRKKRAAARQRALAARFADFPQQYRSASNQMWLQEMIRNMAANRQLVVSATPLTELVILNASTPFHGYRSQRELVTACFSAVQGESRKSFVQGNLNSNLFNVTAGTATAGIATFGWRIRLTASQLNFAFRPFIIDIGPVLNTAGVLTIPTPVITFAVQARRMPVDIFVISPANAAGLATIVPGVQDEIVAAAATTLRSGVLIRTISDASTFGVIETLNARDLVSRATTFGELCRDGDAFSDGGEPVVENDDEGYFSGIRDED